MEGRWERMGNGEAEVVGLGEGMGRAGGEGDGRGDGGSRRGGLRKTAY